MAKQAQKTYSIMARAAVDVSVDITARSLEEANERAKEMKSETFIETLGDCLDINFRITGVYESSSLPEA